MRIRRGIVTRLLHVDGVPIVVRAAQRRDGQVRLRAEGERTECRRVAIQRMRFALGVTDDYRPLYDRFRSDPLLGPAIRRRPWHRPRRRPWPWEALAWAITKQLIESSRAAQIQRRMVFRWGSRARGPHGAELRDVPSPELLAGCAPAELAALDLAPARALALIRAAREVARAGLIPPTRRRSPPAGDPRDRPLDGPVPGPLRSRRAPSAARRGPRLHQAGGAAGRARPPRHRRRGGGVLRPLRSLSRPRRLPDPRRPPQGDRRRAAPSTRRLTRGARRGSMAVVLVDHGVALAAGDHVAIR